MKCPIDQTEMEKGGLVNQGSGWKKSGMLTATQQFGASLIGAGKVVAYKCPKCGKVELKVEEKGDQTSS